MASIVLQSCAAPARTLRRWESHDEMPFTKTPAVGSNPRPQLPIVLGGLLHYHTVVCTFTLPLAGSRTCGSAFESTNAAAQVWVAAAELHCRAGETKPQRQQQHHQHQEQQQQAATSEATTAATTAASPNGSSDNNNSSSKPQRRQQH